MNPEDQFCPNEACRASGQVGAGNIGVHLQVERRYMCSVCRTTFTETVSN